MADEAGQRVLTANVRIYADGSLVLARDMDDVS